MDSEVILVVDDNRDNAELMKILLDGEGWETRFAENAQLALEILGTCHPKLILMDIQMPGMDGLELTRLLRRKPDLRDVVIVALTAYAMKGDEERARAAGCDGYITKPVDTRNFSSQVRRFLDCPGASWNDVNQTGIPMVVPAASSVATNVAGLAPRYLQGKRADAGRIEDALRNGDFETIRILGHNMKGTGNGYGFPAISEIGRNLETAAKEASVTGIQSQVAALSQLLDGLLGA